jgi:FkbM family methyltransferase
MSVPEPYHGWKRYAASVLRFGLRTYIRFAPWSALKATAYEKFDHYVGWLPHSAVVRTRSGFRMRVDTSDLVSSMLYLTGQWEPYLTTYIREVLRPGDIFVDVGANIGYYSLLASRLVGPSGRVYAIEASPTIYASLIENIRLNGCPNITPIHAAASDARGELSIWLADARNRGHSTTVTQLALAAGMRCEATVPADTIGGLIGADVLRRARLVKIDVEGAERAVVAPVLSTPGLLGPDTEWLIELSPDYSEDGQHDADWVFDALRAMGYSAHLVPNAYDPSCYLARPQGAELEPLARMPGRQADVLFRPRGPKCDAGGDGGTRLTGGTLREAVSDRQQRR